MSGKQPARERIQPSRLTKPRAEAEATLRERIAEGEAIVRTLGRGPLPPEADRWHDKNKAILERLFTGAESVEYENCISGGALLPIMDGYGPDDDESSWHAQRLEWLRSLRSRLDVYEAPARIEAVYQSALAETEPLKCEVFVVHGHDEASKQQVARVLERLGLKPIVLHEQPDAGRVILEKFEAHADVGYAVVLLTPDDQCGDKQRARQNVILELGYFFGRLGRGRVLALYKAGVELPSDLHGWLYTPMDEGGAWRFKLGTELRAAGFDVDLNRLA